MADYTINDFVDENGWPDKILGGKPLTRFNTGLRSKYLNLSGVYSKGKVEISMKVFPVEKGIRFILSCGDDGRNPTEIFCNKELGDTVILNINVKYGNVYYCNSQTGRGDVDIIRQLNNDDVKFEHGFWYGVKIILDYNKLTSAEDADLAEWIHFTMTKEGGETLVDTDLTHLSQTVSPNLRQIRIVRKGETEIKDFVFTADAEPDAIETVSGLMPIDLTPEPILDENLPEIPDEETKTRISRGVIITEQEIKIPRYVLKINDNYHTYAEAEPLLKERRSRYNYAVNDYRYDSESEYLKAENLKPYRFNVETHGLDSIITTNDFADRDRLIFKGYKPIYIGNESAVRNYTIDYGTYTGRNTHVIPQNDFQRCQYIVKDTDNMNDVLNGIFAKYPDKPLVITFMDGEYKFHISEGEGTEENPYKVLPLTRDDICLRTFDYNTNFTLVEEDKAKIQNGEKLLFIDGVATIFGLNFFLEDIVYDEQIYKFPELASDVQEIVDYVNSLDVYPGIVTVNDWFSKGLPSQITENIAVQDALFEIAQLVSDMTTTKEGDA